MTFGELKCRICDLLNVDASDTQEGSDYAILKPLLISTVNAVSERVAMGLRCLFKEKRLSFEGGPFGAKTALPKDFAAARYIVMDGKVYEGGVMEIIGNYLYFFAGQEGEYTLGYYAFSEPLSADADENTVLAFDEYAADTLAYGVAAELCHAVHPSNMTTYMRLSTEFDERMTGSLSAVGERWMRNTVFGGRGGFR